MSDLLLLCVRGCAREARYIYAGYSLCYEHFFELTHPESDKENA